MSYRNSTLTQELNRLANGGATYVYGAAATDAEKAANTWAGTSGLSLIAALNVKAGNNNAEQSRRDLNAVCNQLAGTTGLEARDALAQRVS